MTLQPIKKASTALLLSCIVLLFSTNSFAQTVVKYTAIASGNYTSPSTWQGGNVPPSIFGTMQNVRHEVTIPSGITVTLNTNLDLKRGPATNTGALLVVDGTLNGLPGYWFKKGSGYLRGSSNAVINVDSCALLGSTNNPGFEGHTIANTCRLEHFNLYVGTLTVNKKIIMNQLSTNVIFKTMNIGNHCTIETEGWPTLRVSDNNGVMGVINYPDTINISFGQFTNHRNWFLDTNWVNRQIDTMIIDIDSTIIGATQKRKTVSIAYKDLYFNGTLIIKSGNLKLNKQNITFGPNAKLYCTKDLGRIEADDNSDITVNAASNFGTGFIFNKHDTVKNFTLNMGSNTNVTNINNGMTVSGTLDLKKGQLYIGKTQLRMRSGNNATITNAGPNSYVTSEISGALHMDVAASTTKTFPVGTASHYAPVSVKNNSTASDIFKASVVGEILDSATKGLSVSNGEPVVAATWVVDQTATSGANADITFMWPTAMEVNSFDRTMSYLSRFDDNTQKWDTQPTPSAATQSGNFYTHTLSTTSFDAFNDDYFAVFDNHTSLANLSVNSLTANNRIILYPNPTTGNATIAMKLDQTQTIAITLTDVSGRAVYNKAAMQYSTGNHTITLPTGSLNSGLYFVQLTNGQGTVLNSGKLMKQ